MSIEESDVEDVVDDEDVELEDPVDDDTRLDALNEERLRLDSVPEEIELTEELVKGELEKVGDSGGEGGLIVAAHVRDE